MLGVRVRFWMVGALAAVAVGGCSGASHPGSGSTSASDVNVAASTASAPAASVSSSIGPYPSNSVAASSETRASWGQAPPSLPVAARTHTTNGALIFARFYINALDWTAKTSNPSLLRKITSTKCVPCRSNILALEKLGRRAGHLAGGRLELKGLRLVGGGANLAVVADEVVQVTADQTATFEVSDDNRTQEVAPAADHFRDLLYLDWYPHDGWRVIDVGAVTAS